MVLVKMCVFSEWEGGRVWDRKREGLSVFNEENILNSILQPKNIIIIIKNLYSTFTFILSLKRLQNEVKRGQFD